jgi:hypothetical protein
MRSSAIRKSILLKIILLWQLTRWQLSSLSQPVIDTGDRHERHLQQGKSLTALGSRKIDIFDGEDDAEDNGGHAKSA